MKKEKPNVILVLIDGARHETAEKFPNFKKVLAKGSLFSNFVTHAPYTVAACFSLMTGMYGKQTGVNSYYRWYDFRERKCKTIAERLSEAGYYTRGDTLSKIVCPSQGFDEFSIHDEDKDNLGEMHKGILREMKQKNDQGKNFFCFLHYSKIHAGMKVKVLKKFTNYSKEFFENREKYENLYNQYCENADQYIADISKEMESLGFFKNSLVIFFSDHGMSTGDRFGEKAYGTFCYDYTLRTFCSFIFPRIFPRKRFEEQVRLIDIAPTILDAIELKERPKGEKISGKSVLPIIKGEEKDERIAFAETGNRYKDEKPPKKPNIKCIRTTKWKLIYNIVPNSFELYDLEQDPLEEKNLVGKMPEKKKELLLAARKKLGFDPMEDY